MKYINKESLIKIKTYAFAHKFVSIIVIAVILLVGYFSYTKITATATETKYVTTTVKKGTIISTVSGSGQVSTTNQINIVAKVSGDITWLNAKAGQKVYAGQALAGIDSKTAKQAVDDATAALIQTKLQFQKDQTSAPIDYQNSLDALATAKEDLSTTFNDTFNSISSTYLDLPTIITGAQNIIHGYDLSPSNGQWNIDVFKSMFTDESTRAKIVLFAQSAESDYQVARTKYDSSILAYKQLTRQSSNDNIETSLSQSIDTTTAIAQALQSELNLLGAVNDAAQLYNLRLPSAVTTMQTNARSYLSSTNSDLSNLLSKKKAIDTGKQTIKTDEQNITLLQVGNTTGNNPISLQIEQNNLAKQERSLETLRSNLNDYTIVAPFAGTIASVTAQIGSPASTIASIVTNQQVAELSLNEIDATKVSASQKATLTFDAVSDLSLTGTVAEIDPVGTVSQGVVSYSVKITFDAQDPRIKPGMTVNASIQSDVHQDVMYIPSGAVKTSNGQSYVLVFDPALPDTTSTSGVTSTTLPTQISVTTGISDDTNIEIISSLVEGQQIVSRTITSTTKTTTTTTRPATSLLGGGGPGR